MKASGFAGSRPDSLLYDLGTHLAKLRMNYFIGLGDLPPMVALKPGVRGVLKSLSHAFDPLRNLSHRSWKFCGGRATAANPTPGQGSGG
jgi:hypothetical protein